MTPKEFKTIVEAVERPLKATTDEGDLPIPGDYAGSRDLGLYRAGVEAMRSRVLHQLRTGGFNVLANNVNDIAI